MATECLSVRKKSTSPCTVVITGLSGSTFVVETTSSRFVGRKEMDGPNSVHFLTNQCPRSHFLTKRKDALNFFLGSATLKI
jgi:hypothetical protein